MVDLLREHAAHHRTAVLESDRGVVRDGGEQLAVLLRERRVSVADELPDLPAAPAQRQPLGERAGAAVGPGDLAVVEHERRAGRAERIYRRAYDRRERLLEVKRVGDRLGDARERLELVDAALRGRVQARVLDRLRHLSRDREQEIDLRLRELARFDRAHVESALELGQRLIVVALCSIQLP